MNFINKLKRFVAVKFDLNSTPTKRIISFWEKGGPDFEYFEKADQENWLNVFWSENSVFFKLFTLLDLRHTLEIACGTGRHSAKVIDKMEQLYLLDSSKGALEIAKQKFVDYPNVFYVHTDSGYGIPENIAADSLTTVFSYDAMVHFEKEVVFAYISDSYKVLKKGGYALLHHSNYQKNPSGKFTNNPGWRNFMSKDLFTSYAKEVGFKVIQSEIISFSANDSDCITLLMKD